jgi:predicted RecB family nuclease
MGEVLTKSQFQSGRQCLKRLWFDKHQSTLRDPRTDALLDRFQDGNDVDELARQLFPHGVLIRHAAWDQAKSDEATREAIAAGADAVFQGGFSHGSFAVRVDILCNHSRGDNPAQGSLFESDGRRGWELIEVKSSMVPKEGTLPKPEHLSDIAFQYFVLSQAGFIPDHCSLALISREYVYPGGEINVRDFISLVDVTSQVIGLQPTIAELAQEYIEVVAGEQPDVQVGRHCSVPYKCDYFGHCHEGVVVALDDIALIPRIKADRLAGFRERGINSILQLRGEPELSPALGRMIRAIDSGSAVVEREVRDRLLALPRPIHFLDFETVSFVIPRFPGTRPYEVLPCQWSDHVLHADGTIDHSEFLHALPSDPRSDFLQSLYSQLDGAGSIVVYTGYERERLKQLAEWDTDLGASVYRMFGDIEFDMYELVRSFVYHPEFAGSFSLKDVLPAIVDDVGYDDLNIRDGEQAQSRYRRLHSPTASAEEKNQIYADLLAYCKVDTLALVRLFERLIELAE